MRLLSVSRQFHLLIRLYSASIPFPMPHADSTNFPSNLPRSELYCLVYEQATSLLETQTNWVSNTANLSSLLHHAFLSIPLDVNWTGFYILPSASSKTLLLGPFQGKVACQEIQLGKGICGTAAMNGETMVVEDVEKWEGHIACDSESRS